ncbi:PucR family transcriptional regulator [Specibacter cremeus]|uniref:PucR family transcriptional regulator n=1 Tax=Specibacter cremeus TaxID=1629051 RepID=UPI000F7AE52D|nr:PucR family transcriptional regulator [Specibacter cremeus]
MITLADILASPPMAAADPMLRTDVSGTAQRAVRWVHSSEVLEIAPLLRGGELLLSGGQALLALPADEQTAYVRSLGARGIAALALETAGVPDGLSAGIIAAAEAAGVPLIELRRVAPFVDIAEEVNRLIVNEQARAHLLADDLSHRIARQITDLGPHLPTILDLIAARLSAEVLLTTTDGLYVEHAGDVADPAAEPVVSGIIVGGRLAAELTLRSTVTDLVGLEVAADRLSGILAVALAQTFQPSPAQVADTRLVQAIIEDAAPAAVEELWEAAGLPRGRPAVVAIFRARGRDGDFSGVERALRGVGAGIKTHRWDGDLAVLFALTAGHARAGRAALLRAAHDGVRGSTVCAAFGPFVVDGLLAHGSFVEAREVMRIGAPAAGQVLDAMEFLGRRILDELPDGGFVESYIQATVGDVLQWDRKHRTSLAQTLLRWLESGCNTTATAAALHIERQTMHKRLNKIHDLLGEDPRESGNIFTIHLAVKAALSEDRRR